MCSEEWQQRFRRKTNIPSLSNQLSNDEKLTMLVQKWTPCPYLFKSACFVLHVYVCLYQGIKWSAYGIKVLWQLLAQCPCYYSKPFWERHIHQSTLYSVDLILFKHIFTKTEQGCTRENMPFAHFQLNSYSIEIKQTDFTYFLSLA
jgi:hypothetical protein